VVNRVVTGAHYGMRDWLMQRVTAVVMLLYTLLLLGTLMAAPNLGYDAWKHLVGHGAWGLMPYATFIFLLSLFLHAWVGMRDVLMDYVKSAAVRLALEALVIVVLVGYAGWALQILWRL
jgi:succinate dehydrogenase / fumarate reductase membrane anchor subunit